jgi:hypothetical protein
MTTSRSSTKTPIRSATSAALAAPTVLALLGAATATGACGWDQLDAIGPLPATSGPDGGPSVDAGGAEASPDPGPTASTPCAPQTQTTAQWTFDATVQGWTFTLDTGVQASLAWTGDAGDPAPGALALAATPRPGDAGTATGAWLQYDTPLGDLTSRTVSAWVWLDSGTSPHLKVYAQTGPEYVWADNGTVELAPHLWTCVSLPVSSPSYDQAAFDPTDVVRIGFEMLGTEPFRVLVDTVTVY